MYIFNILCKTLCKKTSYARNKNLRADRNTFSDDKIKTANTVFNDLLNDR